MSTIKLVLLYAMCAAYVLAGIGHFKNPKMYLQIMPHYIPYPEAMVAISGVAEIILGLGLFFPLTRGVSAYGVIALLVAVFPANIYMLQLGGARFGMANWLLWVRLPLQFVLIAWAAWYI